MSDSPVTPGLPEAPETHETKVRVSGNSDGFVQEVVAGRHRLIIDEPLVTGGTDTGPAPYDLILAALGACTSMTVSMYARHKGWPLRHVAVSLTHSKGDPAEGGKSDRIKREITFQGPLTEEQRSRLIEIANKCPVSRTLTEGSDITTSEA